jgi:hypothetical protein
MASNERFEKEDLPKILAALKTAKDAGAAATVTVEFAQDGGVIAVVQNIKRKFK